MTDFAAFDRAMSEVYIKDEMGRVVGKHQSSTAPARRAETPNGGVEQRQPVDAAVAASESEAAQAERPD